MARILAIDTTSEHGSLALLDGGNVIEERAVRSPEGFGHVLFSEIEALLGRHGWTLESLDCFAAAAGPGSFTGIRVGLAAVKGLGQALNRPVCAVSNLQALAWFGRGVLRAPLIDARRGEVYAGLYSSELAPVTEEVVLPPERWLEWLPPKEVELIASDFGCVAPLLEDSRLAAARRVIAPRQLAAAVGRIAWQRLVVGKAGSALEAEANYVRRSDAELYSAPG